MEQGRSIELEVMPVMLRTGEVNVGGPEEESSNGRECSMEHGGILVELSILFYLEQ